MDYSLTMTNWVSRLTEGRPEAVEYVVKQYFTDLIHLATREMKGLNQVTRSSEDVALSAIKSFYCGIQKNQFQLNTEEDIWGCLFCITKRKSIAQRRSENAIRRGGRHVIVSANTAQGGEAMSLFDLCEGMEPDPKLAMMMAEDADEFLRMFEEGSVQHQILSLKLQGLTIKEIAQQLELLETTVSWHFKRIRSSWEFAKGIEYLCENMLFGVPCSRMSQMLSLPEEKVCALADQLLQLWLPYSSEEECQALKELWMMPESYQEKLFRRDPVYVRIEQEREKIIAQWIALSSNKWKKPLRKIWVSEPQED